MQEEAAALIAGLVFAGKRTNANSGMVRLGKRPGPLLGARPRDVYA
jgi:hypothetical protein